MERIEEANTSRSFLYQVIGIAKSLTIKTKGEH
jgi:hypothetical protein